MYNIHAIKKPKTFPAFPLNICSLATSTFDPMLRQRISTTVAAFTASNAWSYTYIATSYSCCC